MLWSPVLLSGAGHSHEEIEMSAERMIANAMQRQPTLLLLLLVGYFIVRTLIRAVRGPSSKTHNQMRFNSWS